MERTQDKVSKAEEKPLVYNILIKQKLMTKKNIEQ